MKGDYTSQDWYSDLSDTEKEVIESLREAQTKQGDMLELQQTNEGNDQFFIELGPTSDAELDSISIKFDAKDNRYITFNED